jgi:hypothetical protein
MTTDQSDDQHGSGSKPWLQPAIKRFAASGASNGAFNEQMADNAPLKS